MKKNIIFFACMASMMLMLVRYASAHERDTYKIGDKTYTFVVGSLGEPLVVDDKSGVDFRLSEMSAHSMASGMSMNDEAPAGMAVTGAEKILKVEISAGDKKKTLDFEPAYGQAGAYHAVFIPTVQTTYIYTIVGKLNGVDINLPFTCVAGQVSESSEDKTVVTLPNGVVRQDKIGGFGCPEAKADYGFPEASVSSYELQNNLQNSITSVGNKADASSSTGMMGIGAGILGIVLGAVALVKSRRNV